MRCTGSGLVLSFVAWAVVTSVVAVTVIVLSTGSAIGAPEEVEGLRIQAEAPAGSVVSGEPLVLEATFLNGIEDSGESRIEVYVPEHVGAIPFPSWVFEAEDGTRFSPHVASFQSRWHRGLQGEIMVLGTGAQRRFSTRVTHVVRVADPAGSEPTSDDARPLPPGRYSVTCTYSKDDQDVPYGRQDFRRDLVTHDTLWTGTIESKPFELVVTASDKPVLEVDAPETVAPGAAYPVRLRFANLSAETIEARGAFVVTVGMKARGSGTARFTYQDETLRATSEGHTHLLSLAPGASVEASVDLAAITFRRTHRGVTLERGFADLAHDGTFRLSVAFEREDGSRLATAGMFRRVLPLEPLEGAPLALSVEQVESASRTPVVDVVLRNTSERAVRVPATLAYPENVYFSVILPKDSRRPAHRTSMSGGLEPWNDVPEPGPEALISGDHAWEGDVFERRRDWNAASTVLLAPGSEIRRRFAIGKLITPSALLEWTAEITAYYRNLEPGTRLGLDGMFVGLIRSETVEIKGRGW